jgi:hypothetical protein
MKKKLNIEGIANELAGASLFFTPSNRATKNPIVDTPLPEKPVIQEEQTNRVITDLPTARPSDEPTYRPDDRPTGKGVLVRRGFEWREDQLRALKRLSLKEQMEGKEGSMSQMVRDALDEYLKKRATEE